MIPFNVPPYVEGKCIEYMKNAINVKKISGDGIYTKKCSSWLEKKMNARKVLLTTSCTHATEMASILCDVKKGDEVIMPSFAFCSTANAFIMRGAKIVFVDVRPETMNIDERLIEAAITKKTKVIVPIHYAGVACRMSEIMDIATRNNLIVVEDAAQGVMAKYKGISLGVIGHFGCYSFHETKNYTMGEGGALLIRDKKYIEKAEIIREKGTDRSKFFRGQVDKYRWQDYGSSYLPSDLNAGYLWAQLELAEEINEERLHSWEQYYKELEDLYQKEKISLPHIPVDCEHNAHMFYIKAKDLNERTRLIDFLSERGVSAVFHYIPLHSSPAGLKYGEFYGKDVYTTIESERILRLPMYYGIKKDDISYICEQIHDFYK